MLSVSLAWLHRNEKVLILSYTVMWAVGYSTNSMKWMVDRQGDLVLLKLGFCHLLSAWVRKEGHLSLARIIITWVVHFKCPPTTPSHTAASYQIFQPVTDLPVRSSCSPGNLPFDAAGLCTPRKSVTQGSSVVDPYAVNAAAHIAGGVSMHDIHPK